MITTVGRIKLGKVMPEGFRNIENPLTSKELAKVMTNLAKSVSAEEYKATLKRLNTLGDDVASEYGGIASIHLSDVSIPPELKVMRDRLQRKVYQIAQRSDISSDEKKKLIVATVKEATPAIDKAVVETLSNKDNSFGLLVGAGIKGKPQQLRQLVFGDLLTVDSKMRDIPYPTFRSYGEGITPLQYWTASHGGRYGYIQVQKATADAGYFSKQTRSVVHRQLVVMEDCGKPKPYMVDADDENNVGSLLYKDTKGKSGKIYPANTVITDKILADLTGDILIRSAVCCGAGDGLCARCAGVRESGRLPDVGEAVGLNGINSSNEQITQSGLCLHGDTLVRMADGTAKAIKDITAGELVMASDMLGKQYPAPVVKLHHNGVKDVYKYIFRVGGRGDYRELIATRDHKILKFVYHSNCKNAKVINNTPVIDPVGATPNKHFAILASEEKVEPAHRIYDKRALLLGLLLGDGGYTEAVRYVHLSCADTLMLEDIHNYLESMNLRLVKTPTKYWYRLSIITDEVERDPLTGRFCQLGDRNPAKRMLKDFNIYGKYAHEKEIPDVCFSWDNKAVAELLSGLWATDGSIYQATTNKVPHAALGSTSKVLLEQVKRLLEERFGVYCCPISGNSNGRKRMLYKLSITNMSSVHSLLTILKLPGVKEAKRLQTLQLLSDLLSSKSLFYVTDTACRKTEEYAGAVDTYDIELATDEHLFVLANGLVVSNSSKHSGGESVSANRVKRGFAAIEQFINMPENFVGGAAVSPYAGKVEKIYDAPQGGKFVQINGNPVHVTAGLTATVKVGDTVEAGDLISDGMPNIEKITEYKGIGEGRRAFVEGFYNILQQNGGAVPKKQIEPFARAYVDRIEITDPDGIQGWIYGDITTYNKLAANWKPREGTIEAKPTNAVGQFLEMPALHYTIGTKVTGEVARNLARAGIDTVTVNSKEPPFKAFMPSAKQFAATDEDWITALSGEGLTKSFISHAQRGSDSNIKGTSYFPQMAFIGMTGEKPLTI